MNNTWNDQVNVSVAADFQQQIWPGYEIQEEMTTPDSHDKPQHFYSLYDYSG